MASVSNSLMKAARKAILLSKPRKKELLLVVTDELTLDVGNALFKAASESCNALMLVIQPTGQHGLEPPKLVAETMRKADILYCPTKYSLTHTNAVRAAKRRGARIATLPEMTEEMFVRGMSADYSWIKKENQKLARLLNKTKVVKVKAKNTEFTTEIGGKRFLLDDGDISKKGSLSNLPAGETAFVPKNLNGHWSPYNTQFPTFKCMKGTKFIARNNYVTNITDPKVKNYFWSIRNGRYLAEFAIGTNPGARLSGKVIEDEKVFGTCHVAIGDSKSLSGNIDADIHQDFVIDKPTIWFDDKLIMDKGKTLV
ncbi:MAG: aminopeptidase [Candidatus Diapherotrites archaeon]|nr:aminopeptidase [Candidatus Diapherotrites archaeon]